MGMDHVSYVYARTEGCINDTSAPERMLKTGAYWPLGSVAGLCVALVFGLGSDVLLLNVTIESRICHGISLWSSRNQAFVCSEYVVL